MKKSIIIFIFLFLLLPSITQINAQNPDPFFSLSFLTPNTSTERIEWSELIAQELGQIGVEVNLNNITGWPGIGSRTWGYPLIDYDYIPTYDEGGYDVLFMGWNDYFDWNPEAWFASESIVPYGDNFYQYNNTQFDQKLTEYLLEANITTRIEKGKELQGIIYEDQPAIGIVYLKHVYGFNENIVGMDTTLFGQASDQTQFWDVPSDHNLTFVSPTVFYDNNIFRASSYFDAQWMQAVYGSLLRRSQNSHLFEPEIAKNISYTPIINDEINITVFLDPNAKFSDLSPVLPSDVKYSYELYMTPEVNSDRYGEFAFGYFESLDSIEIIGPDVSGGQLLFKMKVIDYYWMNAFDAGIIDKSEVEPLISTYGYNIFWEPPGTGNVGWSLVKSCGPFVVDKYNPTLNIVNLKTQPYWVNLIASGGSPAKLSELNFKHIPTKEAAFGELLTGEADIIDRYYYYPLSIFEDFSGIIGIKAKSLSHQQLAINMKHPIIGTGELTPIGLAGAARNIRKAISCSIPRDYIAANATSQSQYNYSYDPGILPISEAIVGFLDSLQPYPYDINMARLFMELAGYVITIKEFSNINIFLITVVGLCSILLIRRRKNSKNC